MPKLKFWQPVVAIILLTLTSFKPVDYTGENMLAALGLSPTTKEFKPIKDFWLLDKNYENNFGGIKFVVNNAYGRIESVLIAGENFQLNGVKFSKCTSPLPYGILLTDDTAALRAKLGEGQKVLGRNAIKFYRENITIETAYTDLNKGKIIFIKFYYGSRPVVVPAKEVKPEPTNSAKLDAQRKQLEKQTFYTPPPVTVSVPDAGTTTFKTALLNVFKAYRESYFANVKGGERAGGNFWHYKYTYASKLKIPGEKYSMLYSFPFITSPLDYVSVIQESDAYDVSFKTTYREYEKKLLQSFPASDGWKASCIINKESKTLSDLEFSNDKYGSVVLDYSKNPKGRHILYLRFLLFSN
ncbi:MAG: hypothetical protein KA149_01040 [Chitinophagales bacterium]|nr:hypothetical protein [Chitinophagales bacterium]